VIDDPHDISALLDRLGVDLGPDEGSGDLVSRSPIDGRVLARLRPTAPEAATAAVAAADATFRRWRLVPAPRRGELVRRLAEQLRRHKDDLGLLVTLEAGKIRSEGAGEVQEMIDVCDFAVGLSRQLYGRTIASERPGHRLVESWHPLGPVAVVTAFNFPVAVWAWNAAIALVCGDPVVWKPSEKTPLCALACQSLLDRALAEWGPGEDWSGVSSVVLGGRDVAEVLVDDPRVPLVSATGSTAMGREVGPRVARRFGRSLLELGGNNAMIVAPSADLDLAVRAIVFSAVGTAGQRCTTLRRLIVHSSVAGPLVDRLRAAYATLSIGDPTDAGTLVGPLIDERAASAMAAALDEARRDGGAVHGGEQVVGGVPDGGVYVEPAIVELPAQTDLVRRETFAPILYVLTYGGGIDEAIAVQNDVPQGLSSSLFTTDLREAEAFLGAAGSDCGIANVNVGPSGAEIGGAFGGEKETGGGRESGSDSWRAYMRRSTATINGSGDLPLAQGVDFSLGHPKP
jgi:aldehyde dehydrogenase (NAD+)